MPPRGRAIRAGRVVFAFDAETGEFRSEVRQVGRTLAEGERNAREMTRAMRGLERSFDNTIDRASRFSGFALAGIVAGLGTIITRSAQFSNDITQTASALNTSTDELQRYRRVLALFGGDVNDADEALLTLNERIGQLAEGRGPVDEFRQLGLSARDFGRDAIANFDLVVEGLRRIENEAERVDIARALLGDQEARLALSAAAQFDAEGFRRAREEIAGVVSEENIQRLNNLRNAFIDLGGVIAGELANAVGGISEQLDTFIRENGGELAESLATGVTALTTSITELVGAGEGLARAVDIASFGLQNINTIVDGLVVAFAAPRLLGGIRAIAPAFSGATTSIVAFRAALVGLGTTLSGYLPLAALSAGLFGIIQAVRNTREQQALYNRLVTESRASVGLLNEEAESLLRTHRMIADEQERGLDAAVETQRIQALPTEGPLLRLVPTDRAVAQQAVELRAQIDLLFQTASGALDDNPIARANLFKSLGLDRDSIRADARESVEALNLNAVNLLGALREINADLIAQGTTQSGLAASTVIQPLIRSISEALSMIDGSDQLEPFFQSFDERRAQEEGESVGEAIARGISDGLLAGKRRLEDIVRNLQTDLDVERLRLDLAGEPSAEIDVQVEQLRRERELTVAVQRAQEDLNRAREDGDNMKIAAAEDALRLAEAELAQLPLILDLLRQRLELTSNIALSERELADIRSSGQLALAREAEDIQNQTALIEYQNQVYREANAQIAAIRMQRLSETEERQRIAEVVEAANDQIAVETFRKTRLVGLNRELADAERALTAARMEPDNAERVQRLELEVQRLRDAIAATDDLTEAERQRLAAQGRVALDVNQALEQQFNWQQQIIQSAIQMARSFISFGDTARAELDSVGDVALNLLNILGNLLVNFAFSQATAGLGGIIGGAAQTVTQTATMPVGVSAPSSVPPLTVTNNITATGSADPQQIGEAVNRGVTTALNNYSRQQASPGTSANQSLRAGVAPMFAAAA